MKTTTKRREHEKVCVKMGSYAKHLNWPVHFDCFYLHQSFMYILFHFHSTISTIFLHLFTKWKERLFAHFKLHIFWNIWLDESRRKKRKKPNVMKIAFDILFYHVLYSLNIVLRAHSSTIFVLCKKFIIIFKKRKRWQW